jgi:hypothetical protein
MLDLFLRTERDWIVEVSLSFGTSLSYGMEIEAIRLTTQLTVLLCISWPQMNRAIPMKLLLRSPMGTVNLSVGISTERRERRLPKLPQNTSSTTRSR